MTDGNFSEGPKSSVKDIIESLMIEHPSPEAALDKFFDWYQDVWFLNDHIVSTITNMPRPLREIAIVHQAFGVMSSGGPSSYYLHFETVFDSELMLGLEQLGLSGVYSAILRGRQLSDASSDGELSIEQSAKIYEQLTTPQGSRRPHRQMVGWQISLIISDD